MYDLMSTNYERKKMKNLMMTICLATVVLVSVGCRDTVPKYDPNKNEWKLWAKGVVEKAYIRTSSGTRNFTIEFVNSSDVFKNSTFLNFNDVKVGDRGCIYMGRMGKIFYVGSF